MIPSAGLEPRSVAMDWGLARQRAFDAVSPLGAETVELAEASGRVLSGDVAARLDIPHFASSAMDGWAVAGQQPWRLVRRGGGILPGQAQEVVTGGILPPGAEAVLRNEYGDVAGDLVRICADGVAPRPGEHLRLEAQEARAGDVLLRAGTVLNPAHIAVAASCGVDGLLVAIEPRVALVLTGDEVIDRGLPRPGQVRDSFGPQLPSLLRLLGAAVVDAARVSDDLDATVAALESPTACELIITTGGTGASSADHIRAAVNRMGADWLIPALAVRPGGPTLCARLPDGRLVIGLAGNPLAAITGLMMVGAPMLAGWTGRPMPALRTVTVGAAVAGHSRSTVVTPYAIVDGCAVPSAWTGSAMMRGLADADGLLIVPSPGLRAGHEAVAMALPWRSSR